MAVATDRLQGLRRAGQGGQLTESYQCFDASLRAYLARQTRCTHDAEDLAQEVFLRLWRVGAPSEIRSLKAFAFKAATNLLKDRSRRTYTRMLRNAVPVADVDLPDFGGEPSSVVESLQTLAVIARVIAGLRPTTRDAFLQYRLEARSQADIAANMGVSVSMVEKHVSCAMTAMRSAGVEYQDR
jgi:RNA polymerase sigma factor (sigma-70 family)